MQNSLGFITCGRTLELILRTVPPVTIFRLITSILAISVSIASPHLGNALAGVGAPEAALVTLVVILGAVDLVLGTGTVRVAVASPVARDAEGVGVLMGGALELVVEAGVVGAVELVGAVAAVVLVVA